MMKHLAVLLSFLVLSCFKPLLASPTGDDHMLILADKEPFNGGEPVNIQFKPKVLQIIFDTQNEFSEKLVYEIALEGMEEVTYRTRDPQANFTFLPGGKHRFKYRAFRNGVASNWVYQDINIKRGIEEMPWFMPVALVCLFFILATISTLWILYNFRQKLKLQALRSNISANLHDETGSTLSSISLDLSTLESMLPHDIEDAKNLIAETRNTTDDAILKLRDTLWSIQPEHDDLLDLVGRISQSASRMFAFKPIQFQFENGLSEKDNFQIPMERRSDILHITKEALNNAIKHSKATEVNLRVHPIQDGIQVNISDNGIGFDPNNPPNGGNGLRYFQQRAKNSFLEVLVNSRQNQGTNILVTVPRL